MKIVIVGAGEVGYYLAKRLIAENHNVTIIEPDEERYKRASETLDAMVIQASGSSPKVLKKAGIESADVLLAVSGSDDTNILASLTAKKMGAKKCVARVHSADYVSLKNVIQTQELGIDLVIHPERITADVIIDLVEQSSANKVVSFEGGELQIISLIIKPNSPIINKSIQDVAEENSEIGFLCLAIKRGENSIIPRGSHRYQEGDIAFFIANEEDITKVAKIVGYPEREQQYAMILGAGQIGRLVAATLSREMNVKLIEQDPEVAEEVATTLQDTLVLNGDGTNLDFLTSERIEEMDCVIAVTDSDKTNLLAGLLASHLGVKRVIIHLTTNEYFPIMERIGIHAVVSKNIETVNAIMRYIRRGNVIAVSLFEEIGAEAIELVPREGSYITRYPIRDLDLPEDIIIGAIIRKGAVIIPKGQTQIMVDDKVVVFMKPHLISKVENFFN